MTLSTGEVITLALALIGAMAGFGKLLLSQIDKRFAAADESRTETRHHWDRQFQTLESLSRDNEREILRLRAELPNEYVRREDWIRFSSTIDSKLDMLNAKIDHLRGQAHARD